MKASREYIIRFGGLSDGKHEFQFEIGNKFFDANNFDDFSGLNLTADVVFTKGSNLHNVTFNIKGTATCPCDRCGDDVNLPLEISEKVYISFGNEEEEKNNDSLEMIILPHGETEINLAQFLHEIILVSFPTSRIHPGKKGTKNGCNEEALKALEKLVATNTKKIKETKESTEEIKNPFDILKNIKLN